MACSATLVAFLLALTCLCTTPLHAETADAAVKRYMAATKVGCWDFARRRTNQCLLSRDGMIAGMGEGTFPNDATKTLVAVFAYPNESGGNSVSQFGAVFVETGGRYVFVRRLENIYGENFRDFQFLADNRVRYTATVLQAGDGRCCPTGTESATIDVGKLPARSPVAATESIPSGPEAQAAAKPSWTYGRHPVLGLTAHVVVGDDAFGVACTHADPTSMHVASARMTPGLVPLATEAAIVVYTEPFILGGSTVYRANAAGFVESEGGYCSLHLDSISKSRTMTFIKSKGMSLDWDGRRTTMTVEQDGKRIKLVTGQDMSAVNDTIVVPLTGARAALAKLIKSCPGILRMKDQDCTGGH